MLMSVQRRVRIALAMPRNEDLLQVLVVLDHAQADGAVTGSSDAFPAPSEVVEVLTSEAELSTNLLQITFCQGATSEQEVVHVSNYQTFQGLDAIILGNFIRLPP